MIRWLKKQKIKVINLINRAINSEYDSQTDRSLKQISNVFAVISTTVRSYLFPMLKEESNKAVKKVEKVYGKKSKDEKNIEIVLGPAIERLNQYLASGIRDIRDYIQQKRIILSTTLNVTPIENIIATRAAPNALSKKISEEIVKQIGNGQFVVTQGPSGKIRRYKPETYAKMVARTESANMQSISTIETVKEFGGDLVKVSDHNTTTKICMQYEGNIYSISGDSRKYPRLEVSPPFHVNCTLPDTEVYTDSGWKKMKDVTLKDKCWSLDPLTLKPKFIKIKKLVQSDNDEVVTFENKFTKLTVTANHRMFYQTSWNANHNQDRWGFVSASELVGKKSGKFYRGVKWDGQHSDILYASLVGWIMAEGSIDHKLKRISISQSKSANYDKWLSISQLLDALKIKHSKQDNQFVSYPLYNDFKWMQKQPERIIPEYIMRSDRNSIKAFLDSYCAGDGTIHKGKKFKDYIFKPQRHFFTSSKRMADQLCELIAKSGARPSIRIASKKGTISNHRNGAYASNHDVYCVTECINVYASLQNMTIKSHIISGMKYCVELNENNTLWIKDEKGGVLWIGNCQHRLIPYVE